MSDQDNAAKQDAVSNSELIEPLGVRMLPALAPRVETGPVQFGDDWPGVFVRGDHAGSYALALKHLLGMQHDQRMIFALVELNEFQELLASSAVGPSAKWLQSNP